MPWSEMVTVRQIKLLVVSINIGTLGAIMKTLDEARKGGMKWKNFIRPAGINIVACQVSLSFLGNGMEVSNGD